MKKKTVENFDFKKKYTKSEEYTVIAFLNTLALNFGQNYELKAAANTLKLTSPPQLQEFIFVRLREAQSGLVFILSLSPEIIDLILNQKLGGNSQQVSHIQTKGLVSQRLIETEILAIANKISGFIDKYIPGKWNEWSSKSLRAADLLQFDGYQLSYQQGTKQFCSYCFINSNFFQKIISFFPNKAEEKSQDNSRAILERIKDTEVILRAILGEKQMSIQQVCDLQLGQIIMLPTKKGDIIDIVIGNKKVLRAEFGIRNKRFVLRIA